MGHTAHLWQTAPVVLPHPAPPDLTELEEDAPRRRARAIGQTSLALAGLGAGLIALRAVSIHAPACPFRSVTGVPCPGCGMTRLADAVAHGHLDTATRADAAGVALLAVLAVIAVAHLVRVVVQRGEPPRWLRTWAVPALLLALVAVHWGTTIVTGGLISG